MRERGVFCLEKTHLGRQFSFVFHGIDDVLQRAGIVLAQDVAQDMFCMRPHGVFVRLDAEPLADGQ